MLTVREKIKLYFAITESLLVFKGKTNMQFIQQIK